MIKNYQVKERHILSIWDSLSAIDPVDFKFNKSFNYSVLTAPKFEEFKKLKIDNQTCSDLLIKEFKVKVKNASDTIKKDIETLRVSKINAQKILPLPQNDANDFAHGDFQDYHIVGGDYYFSDKFQLKYIRINLVLNLPVYSEGQGFPNNAIDKFFNLQSPLRFKPLLVLSSLVEIKDELFFTEDFVRYWHTYLKIEDDLFSFNDTHSNREFGLKKNRNLNDLIEETIDLEMETSKIATYCYDKEIYKNDSSLAFTDTLKTWCNKNKLESAYLVNGRWKVNVSELLTYMNKNRGYGNQEKLQFFIKNYFGLDLDL